MSERDLSDPIASRIDAIETEEVPPVETYEEDIDNLPIDDPSDSPIEIPLPDDTPEEISAEEATHSDIPAQIESPNSVPIIAELVCDVCLELNLRERCTIDCKRCGKPFCFHYSSNIDADFCVSCMSDVSVTKSVITKTYESTNDDGEKHFYRRKAREVKIEGLDWLFTQRKIPEYSDSELELTIEYHQARLNLMLAETERRRTEKSHRYAGVKVVFPTTTGTSTTSSTTVKKSRTISKDKAQEQAAALLKSLQAGGMNINDIIAALGGKK